MAFPSRASNWRTALVLGLIAVFAVGVMPWSHWFAAGGAPDVRRLGGTDRYATAASISADLFPAGSKVVYVASGETFPDALSAAAAAGRSAPVLLTAGKKLPAATATELARLHPQLIVAVGGFDVISDSVLAAMRPYSTTGTVTRYAGLDRFATAAAVSRVLFPSGSPTVFLATGLAYPDATAGAPAAAGQPGPLLLVGRDSVPLATTVELSRLRPSRIVLVGGTDVISDAVAKVASQYADTVRQWGGATRIDTSVAVANRISTPGGWTVIANGWSYSDGIVGAAAASFLDGPILFTNSASLSPSVADELKRNAPGHVIVIGGTDAVATAVVDQITEIMRANASTEPSPSSSLDPSQTAVATATGSDSASPSPSATPTATALPVTPVPTPTPAPTAPPPTATPAPPPPTSGIVGYGASTVGGRGGTVSHPTSLAQLRSALSASGPRIIALPTSRQTWDLAGNDLMLNKPFVTLDGGAIIFKGGAVKVTASQVIIQNLTSHAGDQSGNPADVDALTVNGNSACIDHIVLSHVEGLWGPDIGGLAILGCVHDVTVQYGIFGEGLFRSDHPKSTDSPDGHALAFNIADDVGSPAQRVTVYGNLLTTSQGRNPRVIGASCTDLIDNVIYNYVEGPSGNPHSLNVIGNTFEAGPAPAAAGLTMRTEEWRFASDANVWTKLIPDATFVSGNRAIGFSFSAPSGDNLAVRRDAPACAPSVRSGGAAAAYGMVLSVAGPRIRSDQTARLLANAANRRGTFYNGVGRSAPTPSWP